MYVKSAELQRLESLLANVDRTLERLRSPGHPATAGQGLPGEPGDVPMTAAQVDRARRGIQGMFEVGEDTTPTTDEQGKVIHDVAAFFGAHR